MEIVVPSLSILAEPPVAIVDKNAAKHGSAKTAQAYLEFLYSPVGQDLAGKHYYRPRSAEAAKKYESLFPSVKMVTIDGAFGGWSAAQKEHFSDGGVFDQIFEAALAK